jgi:hypothetical protein
MLLLLLIAIVIILIFVINKKSDLIEGLDSFNGRMAIDDQYFYDKLFDDVFYYENEDGGFGTLGIERCLLEIAPGGHCVEYGLSGAAYAFAY